MTEGEKLLWDMKVTAGSRFNAAHRLSQMDNSVNLSLAIFSALLLSISIITVSFELDPKVSRMLSVAGIVASVMSLIFSMKSFADRRAVQSEQLHRFALDISEIRRRYLSEDLINSKVLKKATFEYNSALKIHNINHIEKDYLKYKYDRKWEFEDLEQKNEFEIFFLKTKNSFFENLFGKFGIIISMSLLLYILYTYFYST